MSARQPSNPSTPPVPTEAPTSLPEALAHFRVLASKVDAFFNRVESQHSNDLACSSGCNDCCHVRLTVTSVEAHIISDFWLQLPTAVKDNLEARARDKSDGLCVALGDDGRCTIYEARPLVCRSHGLPLRLRQEGRLPVLDACFRNFTEKGPGAVAPDYVLDQQTLSTALLAIDAAYSRVLGKPPGERVDLAALMLKLAFGETPGPFNVS